MFYVISLKWTAIILGLVLAGLHLPAALAPGKFTGLLKAIPRNYPLGVLLMAVATLWFCFVTAEADLGEISSARSYLITAWLTGGVLMIIFVPTFLSMRALGCLLILLAGLLIDACFLVNTPWRFVLTILAYVWSIVGLVLVHSPELGRDVILYASAKPGRLQAFSWPGVLFGAAVVALGIFVYP